MAYMVPGGMSSESKCHAAYQLPDEMEKVPIHEIA